MRRQLLAALVFAAAFSQAAKTDTTWQYTPYSNEVTDLKVFRPGANPIVWIGTHHGVVRIKGTDTLWLHPTNSKLPGEWISASNVPDTFSITTATAMDSAGGYWIGYRKLNKLAHIDTLGKVTVLDSSMAYPWNAISAIAISKSMIYVGNHNGKVFSSSSSNSTFWAPMAYAYDLSGDGTFLNALAVRGGNELWAGYTINDTVSNRLKRITEKSLTSASTTIRGNIWELTPVQIGSDSGMLVLVSDAARNSGSDTAIFLSSYLNPIDTIAVGKHTFAINLQSSLPYIAVGDSVHQLVATHGFLDLTSAFVWAGGLGCGALLDSGFLLGSTSARGFFRYKNSSLDTLNYGPRFSGTVVGTAAKLDSLWLATDSAVYLKVDSAAFQKIYTPMPGKAILSFSRDSSGTLWIGQSNGLYYSYGSAFKAQNAVPDSIYQMAHSAKYSWFWGRSSAGAYKLYRLYLGTWSMVAMSGVTNTYRDSTAVKKLRAWDDGTLWALCYKTGYTGYIYVYTGLAWTNWTGLSIGSGNNPGHLDFDLASTRLWTVSKDDPRNSAYYAAVAGNGNSSTVASWPEEYYTGDYTGVRTYAESDSSAWFLGSSNDPDAAASSWGLYSNAMTHLYRMHTSADVSSGFSDSLPAYTSVSGTLHQGAAAPGDALLAGGNGGLWIVMHDGVSRMKVTTSTPTIGISGHASSLTSPLASLRAGKLELSLSSAATVRIQVLDLNGRVLERQDLTLTAGTHAVSLSKGQGLRLVRIQASEQSQTLRLPSL